MNDDLRNFHAERDEAFRLFSTDDAEILLWVIFLAALLLDAFGLLA